MVRTMRGVDRIEKQRLTAIAVTADKRKKQHAAQCYQCQLAGSNLRQRCSVFWQLARASHKARRTLRKWEKPFTDSMNPLFTEEECDPPPF